MSSKLRSWFKWSDTDVTSWVFNSFSITFFIVYCFSAISIWSKLFMRLGKTPEFVGVGPEKRIEIMSQWNRNIIQKTLEISTFWCTYLFGKPINNRNIFSLRFLTHKIESLPAGSTLWFIGPRFEVPMNINLEITMLYYQDENLRKNY